MRDPDRIPVILARLEAVWERYPDLRLGQLLMNADAGYLYAIEDEDLARRVEAVYDDLEIRLEQD